MKKYLILPNIRSCHNVGAMFRNADAFGFDRLYLVGYTAQPPKPQIDKVSLGAETWIPWEHRDELEPLIRELREKNVMILGLEKGKRSMKIEKLGSIGKDIALIVGNEVDGISEEALALCDTVIHIPMHGKKESLNVSVAAGVAMYVLAQQ
ncbi:MAG: RNA methyltransferase [Candidatus Magasanikbacteria bacterium CG10_big_fil_rev_8_21_14_0_10_47_10]|uniref:RNA methyltransferase n=1 Tax=Candidatus Magasanikbacteria bacterium CG10_big_fil_rev_8_21_14_0_10_47_10 TaxID=1974652 RepID=A0A2H0TRQ3_9BACT|nr:MAG: RNA methyltransferase [Candidatus Magasanikbacteria bacterium CG10_big_fil_rev_8_21_14_0_10_47_10]